MMKMIRLSLAGTVLLLSIWAQGQTKTKPLPMPVYHALRDSCTQIDVVFSAGTSLSLEGRSVILFSSFVDWKPASAAAVPKTGFLMWQRNGREFLSGDLYLTGDSSGYLVFEKDKMKYYNALTPQGAGFFKKQSSGKNK
ncbi:MAG: hypothetical protein U0T84_13055 [Chitinophagales bacterium]